ncbi:GGDEF domain-containing protein [Rudaea sp.]|uniref:GGDEF domain-containing protein n=1 Tax=Rudaea sp. TaxID=2136325 RepID=UPI002ED237A7
MILLAFQAILLGVAVLLLVRLRSLFGLVPLYVLLGALQILQVLSGAILVSAAPAVAVSPGSAVLFSAGLAAVLLVYIREDALETRRLIYALAAANVITGTLLVSIGWQVEAPGTVNLIGVPASVFKRTAYDLLVGTGLLVLDALGMVILYEALAHRLRGLFVAVAGTIVTVLCLDSVAYISSTLWDRPDYVHILCVSIVSKALAGLWFASIITYYLQRHERDPDVGNVDAGPRDVFSILTYRQKYELIKAASVRDDLTGVYNRAYFNAHFADLLQAAREARRPLTIWFVDIDHFKSINDNHGHAAGDRVISAIAGAIVRSRPQAECVSRYGGEEFVAVLQGVDVEAATNAAERLRREVEQLQVADDLDIPLSITVGVAGFPDDAATAAELVEIADRRLYAGKNAGRNRVISMG